MTLESFSVYIQIYFLQHHCINRPIIFTLYFLVTDEKHELQHLTFTLSHIEKDNMGSPSTFRKTLCSVSEKKTHTKQQCFKTQLLSIPSCQAFIIIVCVGRCILHQYMSPS